MLFKVKKERQRADGVKRGGQRRLDSSTSHGEEYMEVLVLLACVCVSVCVFARARPVCARACKPANAAPQYSGEAAAKGPFS